MRSPSFTSSGRTLPSSLILPLPAEMTSPSCGLSFAESGIMIPPRVVSAFSARRDRMRSCSGVNLVAIVAYSFQELVKLGLGLPESHCLKVKDYWHLTVTSANYRNVSEWLSSVAEE